MTKFTLIISVDSIVVNAVIIEVAIMKHKVISSRECHEYFNEIMVVVDKS